MKKVKSIEFQANLVREYSSSSKVDQLGKSNNRMTLYLSDDKKHANIEWIYNLDTSQEDSVNIGIIFDGNNVVDYDGVFELPKEAEEFLKSLGYNVDLL